MLQLALLFQVLAIVCFLRIATASRPRESATPTRLDPIPGRLYDFYIPTTDRNAAYFAQVEVLAIKDGYVKLKHITFSPDGRSREDIETFEEFRKYTKLVPILKSPFDNDPVTNAAPSNP